MHECNIFVECVCVCEVGRMGVPVKQSCMCVRENGYSIGGGGGGKREK